MAIAFTYNTNIEHFITIKDNRLSFIASLILQEQGQPDRQPLPLPENIEGIAGQINSKQINIDIIQNSFTSLPVQGKTTGIDIFNQSETIPAPKILSNELFIMQAQTVVGIQIKKANPIIDSNAIGIGSSNRNIPNMAGIFIDKSTDTVIQNNLVYILSTMGNSVFASPLALTDTAKAKIYSNTLSVGINMGLPVGLTLKNSNNLDLKSNIFHSSYRNMFGFPFRRYAILTHEDNFPIKYLHNNLFDGRLNILYAKQGDPASEVYELEDLENLFPQQALDPAHPVLPFGENIRDLPALTIKNYLPDRNSPAIDHGYDFSQNLVPGGPTVDIKGNKRGHHPDIGCWERIERVQVDLPQ